MKKITFLLAVLVLSVSSAFAYVIPTGAGQVEIAGMEKVFTVATGYTYQNWASLAGTGVNASYNGLMLTYKGDISSLRFEFTQLDGSAAIVKKIIAWFGSNPQGSMVTLDGSPINLNPANWTTIYISLSNTIGTYTQGGTGTVAVGTILNGVDYGVHMHTGDAANPAGSFTIMDAFLFQAGTSGIADVNADGAVAVAYYTMLGVKLAEEPETGMFIVKYSDGTSAKFFKK